MKSEPFGDRVRRLLEKKGMTQTQLAEEAEIAPAVLSRILTSERDPRLEHVIALARALNVIVAELVGGTAAEAVVDAWVPRLQYEESERARVEAINALEVARADGRASESQVGAMRETIAAKNDRIAQLETEASRQRTELEAARSHRQELTTLREQLPTMRAERDGLTTKVREYEHLLGVCHENFGTLTRGYQDLRSRFAGLQQELSSAKQATVGTAALAALIGGALGAAAASPTKTRRRT